jgi:hypothetical protein
MRTGHRGRVLELADQTRRLTTATGRRTRRHRLAATAATRTIIVRISRLRVPVRHLVPTKLRRVLTRRRAAVILRPRARIRRHRRLHAPTQLQAGATPLLAVVMAVAAAAVTGAVADRMAVVEAPHMVAEVAPTAAAARMDIEAKQKKPAPKWSGLFLRPMPGECSRNSLL